MAETPETVETAAILINGEIITAPRPARHHQLLELHWAAAKGKEGTPRHQLVPPSAQGFVTSTGRFVSREEAALIAVAAGQITAPQWGSRLFSEDLW